ncbi:MerR family transcriptional regulator [Bacillus safensis]|uniref:MerR family transcriptional regulator n=1 Tax=Bacillus TaxID=1386 RepID=UPI000D0230BE|nr:MULTISPECIES: MerR family transcriptional regulator [Bacillus]MBW4848806.1 MerR family transcriptional regulator [Bacillaceae bacterium]MBW4851193.1 MerR family transcriptional regulator [Bacillaceae bacterium]MBW4857022.1 MerR family transcriptional regulator [Bacillaceae bacterium]MCK1974042.1 MerR family transcriptional regulator [Bacillus safensis]MCM3140157.1 MerR family transcriptional regulator [Bacillus safensis]
MKIAQAAKQLDLSTATLRYYENIGLIREIKRDDQGIRDYTEDDLQWIEFIKCMRNAGLSIDALREYTALFFEDDDHTLSSRKNILVNERERLVQKQKEIEETIKRLDFKIESYEDIIHNHEKKLAHQLKTSSN